MALNPDLFTALYKPDVLMCLADLSNDEVFTPPDIANQVLDMLPQELFRDPNTKFLDPALKSGVFLREIAKRLIAGLADKIPNLQDRCDHIFRNQLYGIAITELTSLLGRRSVYCSKYPNSPFSITKFENIQGNILYRKIRHRWDHAGVNGKCIFCGTAYDGDLGDLNREGLETHAYEFIHTVHPEEIFNMKFDVIISNPPYQLSDGGAQASAKPIYNLFVEQAKKLNPRYITMIVPARWYAGGKGLDDFRNTMLSDPHLEEIHDFPNTEDCFPGVNIRGGICYFLWGRDYNGQKKTRVLTHDKDRIVADVYRSLQYKNTGIFIRYYAALSILDKIMHSKDFESMEKHISPRKPFGLDGNFIKTERYHETTSNMKHPIKCYGKAKSQGYIEQSDIAAHKEWISVWKVYMPYANNIGTELNDDNQNSFVGEPNSVCTETFLLTGYDLNLTEEEAINLSNYLKTKFARFLLCQAKNSQHGTAKTYQFVPLVDLRKNWTDDELYAKYGLNKEESAFIDSMIKPMN